MTTPRSARPSHCWVLPLSKVGAADLPLVGGKAANLGELIKAAIDVPDGFVITTDAYGAALEDARLSVPDAAENDPEEFRNRVAGIDLPPGLAEQIATAYARLGSGPVAVRSSATAEDLPGATFAGQQDSELDVVGLPQVIDATRRCWASLWSERAVAYRRRRRIAPAEVRIAVVMQVMVPAEVAGVMFTANPVTGARDQISIDAGRGLGDAVVSGSVTPDHYLLDLAGQLLEASTNSTGRLLSDDRLRKLASVARDVTRHFGGPQDIEWAIVGDRVSIVQTRSMTALPPPPVRLSRLQRKLAAVVLEMLPVRPYPIDMTTWIPHGPVGWMARLTRFVGVQDLFDRLLIEEEGVVTRFVPPSPRLTLGILRAPYRLLRRAAHYDPARWREDPRYAEFRAAVDDLARRDPTVLDWPELVRLPHAAMSRIDPVFELRIDYLPGAALAVVRLYLALIVLRRRSLLGPLIVGADTLTAQANRGLEMLAARVRDDPDLRDALTGGLGGLDGLDEFPEFATAFEDYLSTYGHRETVSPILASQPTWAECPEMVLQLVIAQAAATAPAQPTRSEGEHLSGRVGQWAAAARAGMGFREDSHAEFIRPLPILRAALLEIGRRLVGAGVLDEPEDVYHLRLAELESIPNLNALDQDARTTLRDLMRARAAKREEMTGVPLIDPGLVYGKPSTEGALVRGTPAGGGRASGPVRVIRGPEEFTSLLPGEILVCPYTNPAWTPLFSRAAAVVVDTGGPGSHAAIVAREYGLPTIMGTVTGTRQLSDGQRVVVDGGAGLVLDQEPLR